MVKRTRVRTLRRSGSRGKTRGRTLRRSRTRTRTYYGGNATTSSACKKKLCTWNLATSSCSC